MRLSYFGITTVLFHRKVPVIGSIILTDRCNLSCLHCAVNNITSELYPYTRIRADMEGMYADGIRFLLFYGGEPFLWTDDGITLRELVIEAKKMGFLVVNVVTNGTFPLDLPEADLIMVSLDGSRDRHNMIRGDTYDCIIKNIEEAAADNVCLYMAINHINQEDVEAVCETAKKIRNVKCISFNFHTPYPGTEYLGLSRKEKKDCCDRIARLIRGGYPILNLKSALPYVMNNSAKLPCYQCIVVENGSRWTCGRCKDIEGLCKECGFFFATEFSLVFSGNIKVTADMFKTYSKYF
ncbi:radical SAM protein [Parasporobacterium paucivorans]|nr:radical SAM protein [Parasporobacterium paucivorans]